MKEIWDLAVSPAMLPLTILLVPVGIYWLISLIGLAGHGAHGHGGHHHHHHHHHVGDGHSHHPHVPHSGGHHPHGAHPHAGAHGHDSHHHQHSHHSHDDGNFGTHLMHGVLRILNAEETPLMTVLSVLIAFLWGAAMLAHVWFHPGSSGWINAAVVLGSLVSAIILTRLALTPLKPLFKLLQNDAEPETPIIGRSGHVRTAYVDENYGQIVVENRGAPIIVGARAVEGHEPISRHTKVLVVARDSESGLYVVRPSNEVSH